ncbi:hypothetical protein [Nocardia sp. NPDC052112]|uniref:hypothetical protein n=1 Tax=Nocardia sp. NPDC052112 TaxID=3155646 RepID=UPI003448F904
MFAPTIGRQLLGLGLVDEIDLHIAPILLGAGMGLYDNPGGAPSRLRSVGEGDPTSAAMSATNDKVSRAGRFCAVAGAAGPLRGHSCASDRVE